MGGFSVDLGEVFSGAIAPIGTAASGIIEAASPDAQRTKREQARYMAKAASANASRERAMADRAIAEAQRGLAERRMSGEDAVRRERERDERRATMIYAGLGTVAAVGIAFAIAIGKEMRP